MHVISLLAIVFTPFSVEVETLLVFLGAFSVDEMIYGMNDLGYGTSGTMTIAIMSAILALA